MPSTSETSLGNSSSSSSLDLLPTEDLIISHSSRLVAADLSITHWLFEGTTTFQSSGPPPSAISYLAFPAGKASPARVRKRTMRLRILHEEPWSSMQKLVRSKQQGVAGTINQHLPSEYPRLMSARFELHQPGDQFGHPSEVEGGSWTSARTVQERCVRHGCKCFRNATWSCLTRVSRGLRGQESSSLGR